MEPRCEKCGQKLPMVVEQKAPDHWDVLPVLEKQERGQEPHPHAPPCQDMGVTDGSDAEY